MTIMSTAWKKKSLWQIFEYTTRKQICFEHNQLSDRLSLHHSERYNYALHSWPLPGKGQKLYVRAKHFSSSSSSFFCFTQHRKRSNCDCVAFLFSILLWYFNSIPSVCSSIKFEAHEQWTYYSCTCYMRQYRFIFCCSFLVVFSSLPLG